MSAFDERVLALPPTRRDGQVTSALLARGGLACVECESVAALTAEIGRGVGVVLLTDLSLTDAGMPMLMQALESQAPWAEVPVVMLARDRETSPAARAMLDRLTNVTLLDRPVSTRSLVSTVQAALRARRRQYQMRGHIESQARAERALRDADRRKDEFLATLAHELRNPLAPLRTGIEVLKSQSTDDSAPARMVRMMERQIVLLTRLIDDLLDVARIASGKIELAREALDLREVVDAAVEGCAPAMQAAGHEMVVRMPAQPVAVMGDRARLTQVLGNLLNNAAKYTPDGGRVTVTLEARDGEALLRVQDTGVGITPEMLTRVFDMFTQVEGSLYRAQGGLGLGLSLVRSLVEMHGGTVIAHSAGPLQGSTFTIELPRLPVAETRRAAVPSAALSAEARALRVLVIDDNVDAADALAMSLGALGVAVWCANGGTAGIAAARERLPDVIFCDIGMPGMTGYEVAAALRRETVLRRPMLVALTGWGGAEDKQRARAAGFDEHLVKPASIEQVERVLDAAGARQSTPTQP